MVETKGGIDLDPANLDLQTEGDPIQMDLPGEGKYLRIAIQQFQANRTLVLNVSDGWLQDRLAVELLIPDLANVPGYDTDASLRTGEATHVSYTWSDWTSTGRFHGVVPPRDPGTLIHSAVWEQFIVSWQ